MSNGRILRLHALKHIRMKRKLFYEDYILVTQQCIPNTLQEAVPIRLLNNMTPDPHCLSTIWAQEVNVLKTQLCMWFASLVSN